jgi:hypothetical protein
MYIGLNVNYRLIWSDFNEIFLERFTEKSTVIPNFMKIRLKGAELCYAERQTDRHDEANSHISHFGEPPPPLKVSYCHGM